jgi:hypothetical protein
MHIAPDFIKNGLIIAPDFIKNGLIIAPENKQNGIFNEKQYAIGNTEIVQFQSAQFPNFLAPKNKQLCMNCSISIY